MSVPRDTEYLQRVILTNILHNNKLYYEHSGSLKPEMFEGFYRAAFKTVKDQLDNGVPVDHVMLVDLMREKYREFPVATMVTELAKAPSYSQMKAYIVSLQKKNAINQMRHLSMELREMCEDKSLDYDKVLEECGSKIAAVVASNASERKTLPATISSFMQMFEKRKSGEIKSISSGYIDLDRVTYGFHPGRLISVAGRPGMGKSAFAGNLALNIAQRNEFVGMMSLEMTSEENTARFCGMISGLSAEKILYGDIHEPEQLARLRSALFDEFSKCALEVNDQPSQTLNDILNQVRYWSIVKGIKVLVVDQLSHIVDTGKHFSKTDMLEKIIRGLKNLAKELKITVILLCQISRGVEERENKRPMLTDLKDSGAIEQESDLVMLLYRDEYYTREKSEYPGIIEVDIPKNRHGRTTRFKLRFNPETTRITNMDGRII